MGLYLRGQHDAVSESFLALLRHFRDTTYYRLDAQGQRFIDEFVKHFLTLFTQADYTLARPYEAEFVRLNATISNLAALSSFRTTDPFLEMLGETPSGFAKRLALCSARNRTV